MLDDQVLDSDAIPSFFKKFQQDKECVMPTSVRQTLRQGDSISYEGYNAVLFNFDDVSSQVTSQISLCLGPIGIPVVREKVTNNLYFYHPLTGHYLGNGLPQERLD